MQRVSERLARDMHTDEHGTTLVIRRSHGFGRNLWRALTALSDWRVPVAVTVVAAALCGFIINGPLVHAEPLFNRSVDEETGYRTTLTPSELPT